MRVLFKVSLVGERVREWESGRVGTLINHT